MDNQKVLICCNVRCPNRLSCAKFQRGLEANAGRIKNYEIVDKCMYE